VITRFLPPKRPAGICHSAAEIRPNQQYCPIYTACGATLSPVRFEAFEGNPRRDLSQCRREFHNKKWLRWRNMKIRQYGILAIFETPTPINL
jgi:hypothetical protein